MEPTVAVRQDLLIVSISDEIDVVEVSETPDAPEAEGAERALATVAFTLSALYDSVQHLELRDEELDALGRTSSTLTLVP